jgi:transcriptional regulatory protein GAL4
MQQILPVNPSAQECYNVIQRLCGPFLQAQVNDRPLGSTPDSTFAGYPPQESTQESPQTQINNVYAMMWPNANPAEVDLLMQDGLWSGFFPDMEGSMPQTMDGQGDNGSTQFPWD